MGYPSKFARTGYYDLLFRNLNTFGYDGLNLPSYGRSFSSCFHLQASTRICPRRDPIASIAIGIGSPIDVHTNKRLLSLIERTPRPTTSSPRHTTSISIPSSAELCLLRRQTSLCRYSYTEVERSRGRRRRRRVVADDGESFPRVSSSSRAALVHFFLQSSFLAFMRRLQTPSPSPPPKEFPFVAESRPVQTKLVNA